MALDLLGGDVGLRSGAKRKDRANRTVGIANFC